MTQSKSPPGLKQCLDCIVRMDGLCGELSDEQVAVFNKVSRQRRFERGAQILSSNAETEFAAVITSGVVKVIKALSDGRQQIVGLLFPGDSLDAPFSGANNYTAEAATDVDLCTFERTGFNRMVATFPELGLRLLDQAKSELSLAHEWMVLLGRKTAEEKVATLLLMLAMRSQPAGRPAGGGGTASAPLNSELFLRRDEIADFLGLTAETVSRQISRFKKEGIVKFQGVRHFTILDVTALKAIAK